MPRKSKKSSGVNGSAPATQHDLSLWGGELTRRIDGLEHEISGVKKELKEHSRILAEHSQILEKHSRILESILKVLESIDGRLATMADHAERLDRQEQKLFAIERHLRFPK